MGNNFEKKVAGKKIRGIVIGVLLAAAIGVGIWQLVINTGATELSVGEGEESIKVSMEIKCDTLSSDISKLTNKKKEEYVPKDGVILSETEYKVGTETTAFDLVKEATKEEGIQGEYSYNGAYNIYFVDAINYIYAGDAGPMSGWMYYVNGEMAQVGAADYKLKDGDEILWVYTCDGGGDIKLDE